MDKSIQNGYNGVFRVVFDPDPLNIRGLERVFKRGGLQMSVVRLLAREDLEGQAGRSGRGDWGTRERWQHAGRQVEPSDQAGVCVARVMEEHVLDRLVVMGAIGSSEREAALRFKGDYHAAGLMCRLAGSYSPVRGSFSVYGGWDERSDAQEEAYGRWRQAMRFLKGDLADTVVSIVCYDVFPDAYKLRCLRAGLKVLVTVYGPKGARKDA